MHGSARRAMFDTHGGARIGTGPADGLVSGSSRGLMGLRVHLPAQWMEVVVKVVFGTFSEGAFSAVSGLKALRGRDHGWWGDRAVG